MCKKMDCKKLSEEGHRQLLSVYNHTISDIEMAKQWQWRFTYYALLAQWAIYASYIKYSESQCNMQTWGSVALRDIVIVILMLIAFPSISLIQYSQSSIREFRRRMEQCRDCFEESVKLIFGCRPASTKIPFNCLCIAAVFINMATISMFLFWPRNLLN